jgi:nucleoside-diphosphate-sugar epimerase
VLVQESITFTYEDGADRWLDEEAPVRAHHNLASALDAEATARSFGTDAGVGIVLRFAAFYGPDSHHTRDQLAMARRGLPVTAGEEQGFVSSIHTDDASAAVALAVEAASRGALPSGVYNVGDDEPLARRAVADALAGAAGKAHGRVGGRAFRLAGGAKLEPLTRSQRVSNRRFKDAAAWTPAWSSFVQGLSALSPMLSAPRTPR